MFLKNVRCEAAQATGLKAQGPFAVLLLVVKSCDLCSSAVSLCRLLPLLLAPTDKDLRLACYLAYVPEHTIPWTRIILCM